MPSIPEDDPMPELPDVETFKRYADATCLHKTIRSVSVEAADLLQGVSARRLAERLRDRSLESGRRHGKHLFLAIAGDGWLVLHFGMTGRLDYAGDDGDPPDYTRLLLRFANGYRLAYVAPRKLGLIALTEDVDDFVAEHDLGPDALDLDEAGLRAQAAGRRGQVKAWLMDQSAMAGVGNVYSDEILLRAGLHPRRKVRDLSDDQIGRLHRALHEVLEAAIRAKADPDAMPDDFILPQREDGAPCPRCGGEIRAVKAAGRTAYYCPECQPG
jgi:formamidopyrimidine-DNA glycosylase